ncbi:MAG TPA: heat-inducible transcriptional repressor HrcA [Verrucomicrobiae bacterium]|nr:heat-inducible transcriptional repressor HrcA [Verrucomicrobiae bacterium]
MEMDERKRKVLQAIVLDYIATAEPVGSRTIARKFDLGVSSATIRNEMADLEDMGLIEQPHTSAGRIPSNSGYRYYVDCLMQKTSLSEKEKTVIEDIIFQKIKKIQGLVHETSRLLSQVTNLTSMVLTNQQGGGVFHQVHLLPYQPAKALMVVVKDGGAVENHIIDVAEGTTQEDLLRVSNLLNHRLKGLTHEHIKTKVLGELYSELARQKDLISMAMEVLKPILDSNDEDGLVLGGTINMLNQPEFKDVEKLKTVLKVLEEGQVLRKVLSRETGQGLTVRIGGENKLEEMQDCSIITAAYKLDGQTLGVIGVLGPTRMDYAKICSVVEFMTQNLSSVINRYYK